jgi:hypothetical protein
MSLCKFIYVQTTTYSTRVHNQRSHRNECGMNILSWRHHAVGFVICDTDTHMNRTKCTQNSRVTREVQITAFCTCSVKLVTYIVRFAKVTIFADCLSECKGKINSEVYKESKAVSLSPYRCQKGREVQLLLILVLATSWGWLVSVTPRPCFIPRERTPLPIR